MAVARNYHSSATLMSDGRVLVAGGGHEDSLGGQAQYNAQIYSPPYLSAGPRPTIASAPSSATYGSSMTVATPDAANISAVNLVSLGADTHQSDMDQHFVPLSFTAGSGSLAVQAPAGEALAPPGDYMMFIVNSTGVPSVAAPVHIDAAAAVPGAPTGVTAIAGNGSATVSWTAPAVGGSPVTSYTVTPYLGTTAQPPVTVTGNPPAISTTVTGLTNGSAYTFTAAATNAVGTGPTSAPSGAVTPGAVGPIGVDKTVFTDGTGTMASPAITTSGPGELLVALVSLDGPAAAAGQAATVTGAGLTWTLARRANTRYGDAEIWYARATGTLTNQTVTATPAASGFHGSMTVLALQKAAGIGTGAAASAATGAPDLPIAGTGIGSWVYAVGNDWDGATTRTPSTGQVLVHQRVDTPVGDTFWVQTTTSANTAAGTVDIHDTAPTNHQWNVSAVEVLPGT